MLPLVPWHLASGTGHRAAAGARAEQDVHGIGDELPTALDVLPTMVDVLPTMLDDLPTTLDVLPTTLDDLPTMLDVLPTMLDDLPTALDVLPTTLDLSDGGSPALGQTPRIQTSPGWGSAVAAPVAAGRGIGVPGRAPRRSRSPAAVGQPGTAAPAAAGAPELVTAPRKPRYRGGPDPRALACCSSFPVIAGCVFALSTHEESSCLFVT